MSDLLKLVVDAHVGGPLYSRLEQDSRFDVERVVDVLDPDAEDSEIWQYASENDRIILTNDEDFVSGVAEREGYSRPGVIRYIGYDWRRIHQALIRVHHQFTHDQIVEVGRPLHIPGEWA